MFVHLSDLHFGEDELGGYKLRLTFPGNFQSLNPIFGLLKPHIKGHEFGILRVLRENLLNILGNAGKKDFDLYIVTGDVATQPSVDAYKYAWDALMTPIASPYFKRWGLEIDPKKLLIIPGNHDKLFTDNLVEYHRAFGQHMSIPKCPQEGCWVEPRIVDGREFVFLLLDTSNYAPTNPFHTQITLNTASGLFDRRRMDAISQCMQGVSTNAIRVALIHHALSEEPFGPGHPALPDDMKNNDHLVELLIRLQFKLVLHGHHHYACMYQAPTLGQTNLHPSRWKGKLQTIAASTTSQKSKRSQTNGFYVYTIDEHRNFSADSYIWKGNRFGLQTSSSRANLLQV